MPLSNCNLNLNVRDISKSFALTGPNAFKKYIFYTSDIGGRRFIQTNTELQVHTRITALNYLSTTPHLRTKNSFSK